MNVNMLKEALEEILRCDRLDVAKEIAADVLDVDPSDYIDEDSLCTGSYDDYGEEVDANDILLKFE